MLMLLFMKQADTLNPKEWSSIRQHNCLIKLKGKRAGYVKNTRIVVFREDRAKDCQAIEELQRICCEETDKARQLKIDEPSMQQRENPSTVHQLLAQIQDFAGQGDFIERRKRIL